MCLFSFDKKKYEDTIKNEGIQEGEKKGKFNTTYNFIKQGLITVEQAASAMGLTTKQLLDNFKKFNLAF